MEVRGLVVRDPSLAMRGRVLVVADRLSDTRGPVMSFRSSPMRERSTLVGLGVMLFCNFNCVA